MSDNLLLGNIGGGLNDINRVLLTDSADEIMA